MNLKRRIEKLEQGVKTENGPQIITWATEGPLIELQHGDQVWKRGADEDEENFITRVKAAVGKGVNFLWGETQDPAYI